jgi:ATP-dependent protease ClpP protease subunit
MLHPSANRFQAGELVGVVALRQIISNLEASDARQASILEDRTSMSSDDAKAMVEATTVLNADQAVSAGIAQEIKLLEVEPANAPFFPLGPYPYPGE